MSKNNYQNWPKLDLIKEIERLKKRKKYGLVWEDKSEKVVELCKDKLPVVKEIKNKAISTDKNKPVNLLIEGDNYHALSVLNYTHEKAIDVIYIDPPYNTGSEGFKFNDRIVDREDPYRHSKWLSFMNKRLQLAKKLLSKRGVMFISIDDNELPKLRLLCDELFREDWVDIMIWRKSGFGREGKMKNVTTFRKDHEYIVVIFKDERFLNKIKETPDFRYEYGNPDNDPRGPYKAGSISRREDASDSNHPNYYTVTSPSGKKFTRQFDVPEYEFKKLDNDVLINKFGKKVSRIYWGKKGDAVPAIKIFLNEQREITPYSILMKGTTTEGTKHLENVLGGDFKSLRPKPVPLIKTLVQLASTDNSIVLDFFAGSGTTGEAVLELDKELGGNRSYILCTNDESGICTEVCYPRVKKVIRGYTGKKDKKKYPKLGGNLKYYRTNFVDAEPTDKNKKKLTSEATEMLCIKEGTFEPVLNRKHIKIFKNSNHCTGIIFDQLAIPEFKRAIKDIKGKFSVYVFSLSDETFDEEFTDVKQKIKLSPIPEAILRVYRRIFK